MCPGPWSGPLVTYTPILAFHYVIEKGTGTTSIYRQMHQVIRCDWGRLTYHPPGHSVAIQVCYMKKYRGRFSPAAQNSWRELWLYQEPTKGAFDPNYDINALKFFFGKYGDLYLAKVFKGCIVIIYRLPRKNNFQASAPFFARAALGCWANNLDL